MTKAKEMWFLVADSEHARLMHGTLTAHGRPHVDEIVQIKSSFHVGQHQRPTRMTGHGHSPSFGHEHEEKLAHFAREVAGLLQKELPGRQIAECAVFAPSHFVGALRKELPKALAERLQEFEVEIANLTSAQLAEHPKITDRLGM